MWELKKVGVISVAKIYSIIMAIVGFVLGLFITIGTLIFGAAMTTMNGATYPGIAFLPVAIGILSIILTPIFFAIVGFIIGAVFAIIYNWVASWAGGVELDLQKPGSLMNRIPKPRKKRR